MRSYEQFLVFWNLKIRFTSVNLVYLQEIMGNFGHFSHFTLYWWFRWVNFWFFPHKTDLKIRFTSVNLVHLQDIMGNFGHFFPFYSILIVSLGEFLIFSPKNGSSSQKVQKYWKSENGVKTALTPLFKELWAIFGFLKFKNQIYYMNLVDRSKIQCKIFRVYGFFLTPSIQCFFDTKSYSH